MQEVHANGVDILCSASFRYLEITHCVWLYRFSTQLLMPNNNNLSNKLFEAVHRGAVWVHNIKKHVSNFGVLTN
jgi:hypothetical protein